MSVARAMPEDGDPVARLQRWQDSGAIWRVTARRGDGMTVGLYTCDGGEQVDRLTSSDSELLRFVGERNSSETSARE